VLAAGVLMLAALMPAAAAQNQKAACDWAEYGHDPGLSFSVPTGCSGITATNVATLIPKWFFHATDSVTASPAVVGSTLYVGGWDGKFYALNTANGALRWMFKITVTAALAFGQITSSAVVVPFPDRRTGTSRLVVIFGGGSSIWALDAATGQLLAQQDLDPRNAALKAKQGNNPATVEVESSPVVATINLDGRAQQVIYSGMDVHNGAHVGPAGVVALQLGDNAAGHWSFATLWKHDPETDRSYTPANSADPLTAGSGTGQGCGDVWSSPAVDPATNEVVFGTGNCDHVDAARAAGLHWSESMNAVRADTGALIWRFQPAALAPTKVAQDAQGYADDDFGASPNIFTMPDGRRVVGEASKASVYWVRDLRTGAPVWDTESGTPGNLDTNFAVGGFIGSTAVAPRADGRAAEIIGGTAIPIPHSASDVIGALQSIHAFDAATGKVAWTDSIAAPTYGSTSVVNGVALVPDTLTSSLLAIDAATGAPLGIFPIIGPPSSTAAVAGNDVYVGTGTSETDLEYKALGLTLQKSFTDLIGESPLAPLSGIQAFQLALP
jgi:outer membrane protein assembly factor BamB